MHHLQKTYKSRYKKEIDLTMVAINISHGDIGGNDVGYNDTNYTDGIKIRNTSRNAKESPSGNI